MASRFLFTSESVTEGHPDKICDQISDTILDTLLAQDPRSRVAAEVVVNTGLVLITGEITTKAHVNYVDIARKKIAEIGYISADNGFSANSCAVMVALDEQSPDIAQGVNVAHEVRTGAEEEAALEAIGAGDQGIMFGYACDETTEFMPMPIAIAHRLARQLAVIRKNGTLAYLRPDGKTQVTVVYEGDKPVAIDTILISTQHDAAIDDITDEAKVQARIKADLWTHVVLPSFADTSIKPNEQTRYLVNPTGKFVIGGPQGDSGLTGRKIIVDTYGGYARHGGGAFSGKDPTKVDRSAAYAARHAAKNIVAAGLASKCELQISYAIGVARPTSMHIETFGTGKVDEDTLLRLVKDNFDLRPAAIIKNFDLQNLPSVRGGRFYQDVAAYGHMGRNDLDLPWERLDKVEILKKNA
ncbi:MAG: methionine adenosyltransferase [Pseudanabaena sp. CAN_BIN31]|nr:methionine adenosyltransferase [Pseudanabaena sp. CAN_BIN31]